MADVFELLGRIGVDTKQADSALDGVKRRGEGAASGLGSAFKKIAGVVVAALAVDKIKDFGKATLEAAANADAMAAQFGQVMGEMGPQAKRAVDSLAKEFGMVDTRVQPLFTSMTSKFKGLGLDTEAAMKKAAQATQITADAAAFYDKSFEDAQAALNSFVNGSYEGGEAIGLFANDTQLAAFAVKKGIVESTKEWAALDEASKQAARLDFATQMQKNAGATGQAARESNSLANQTGNLSANWQKLLAAIGGGGPLVAITGSILPGLSGIVGALAGVVSGADGAGAALDTAVQGFASGITGTGPALSSFGGSIATIFTALGPAIQAALPAIVTGIVGMTPSLLTAAIQFFMALVQGFVQAIPQLTSQLVAMIPVLVTTLVTAIPQLITGALQFFMAIVQAIPQIIPPLINGIIDLLPTLITSLIGMLPQLIDGAFKLFIGIVNALPKIIPRLITAVVQLLPKIITTLIGLIPQLITGGIQLFTALVKAIPKIIPALVAAIPQLIKSIIGALIDATPQMLEAGKDIIRGLIEGVGAMGNALWEAAQNIAKSAVDAVKSFLGIKSPSRVFRELGRWTGEGFVRGLRGTESQVAAAGRSMVDKLRKAVDAKAISEAVSKATIAVVKSGTKAIEAVAVKHKIVVGQLKEAQKDLSKILEDSVKKAGEIRDSIASKIDASTFFDPADMANAMRTQLDSVGAFQKRLAELTKMGLDSVSRDQLVAGFLQNGSTAAADALAAGGKTAVQQIAKLRAMLTKAGQGLGDTVAGQMYQAAVKDAEKKLKDFEKRAAALEKKIKSMSAKLAERVKDKLGGKKSTKKKTPKKKTKPKGSAGTAAIPPPPAPPVNPAAIPAVPIQPTVAVQPTPAEAALQAELSGIKALLADTLMALAERGDIVLDTGLLVGAIRGKMDRSLGEISTQKGRGNI